MQPAKKAFIFNAATDTGGTIQPGGKPFKLSATSDKKAHLAAAEVWSNNAAEPYELAVGAELTPDLASPISPNAKGTISPPGSLPGGGRLYLVVYAGENGPIRPPLAV